MKKILSIVLLALAFSNCGSRKGVSQNFEFRTVSVDTILKDNISVRAILINNNTLWYAADKGRYGFYNLENHQKFQSKIANDSLSIEFRSIAATSKNIFMLNIGNPALLYKIATDGLQSQLVYQENNEKVFYDSMQFWNDNEGIAVGDPTENCLSIIITRDGGHSWQKIPCTNLPSVVDGEAAFAASNTNIIIKKNKTWIVSGGLKSRVFYSPNQGKTWDVFETPIIQGLATTGIYSADFYDDRIGFAAGGNYEAPNQNSNNKISTDDGGKSWRLVAENSGFGYASCVQYVPKSAGKALVSVGTSGLQYSADSGKTWTKFLDNKDLYTIRFVNEHTAFAAGRNIILQLHFN